MNLQGQIVQLMRQMETQKEIAIGGIELFKQKNQTLQDQVSSLQYHLQQEQETSSRLEASLKEQQDKVYHAFKQMNDHVEDRFKSMEQTFGSHLKELQQHTSDALSHFDTRLHSQATMFQQSMETQHQQDSLQIEQLKKDFQTKLDLQHQTWEQHQESTKEFSATKFQEFQSKITDLESQHQLANRVPKIESHLVQLNNSLLATSQQHGQLLDTSIHDMVSAMDILKQTVTLLKNEDIQGRKSLLEDVKKMKNELSLELVKVREQLRKEMRYIEKPLLVLN